MTVNDPCPPAPASAGPISPAYTGAGSCAITGVVAHPMRPACTIGTMAPGASDLVHISSATTAASVLLPTRNTATLTLDQRRVRRR